MEEITGDLEPLELADGGQILLPCRLCACSCDKIVGIYSEEGVSNEIATKINQYLPVSVSEDDTLPLQCCLNCASTLLAWHELFLACVEAEKRLLELELNADKEIDFQDAEPEQGTDHEMDLAPEPMTSQKTEAMAEPDAVSLNAFCQSALIKKENASNASLELANPNLVWLKQEKQEVADNNMIANLMCDVKAVPDLVKLERRSDRKKGSKRTYKYMNMASESEETNELSDCQLYLSDSSTKEDDVDRIKLDHSSYSKATSRKERRKNTKLDQEAINSAKVVVEGKVYYNCKTCGKNLHSPYTYIWHMRIHTGERPFVCDLCGKQFRVSQGLVRHLKETHEGIKNFPCDICGRMFATKRNVEEHRRIHTNERPYICDLCGKSFKQKASLFVHNRSHTNYFPYRCSYCNQGFRTRPPLLIHVTRHTGEKPYPCDICGRCFRIKYELKRHMLIHSDDKPFICVECGVSFRQKRYLRNHTRINHNRLITI